MSLLLNSNNLVNWLFVSQDHIE